MKASGRLSLEPRVVKEVSTHRADTTLVPTSSADTRLPATALDLDGHTGRDGGLEVYEGRGSGHRGRDRGLDWRSDGR